MRKGLAIITGADGGMGREITRAVALAGYCVVMACYNAEKAEVKRKLLIEETGNADIMVMSIDLSSLASVNAFACRMLEELGAENIADHAGAWRQAGFADE